MRKLQTNKPDERRAVSTPQAKPRHTSRRQFIGLAILIAAGGYIGWQRYISAPDYAGGAMSVAEAHAAALNGEITLIDIRRPDEWKRTGVGQAAHPIDMRRDDFEVALRAVAGDDPAAPIALICARGVRSARLSNRLSAAGFSQIIDVPEGMLGSGAGPGWLGAGLPVRAYDEASG